MAKCFLPEPIFVVLLIAVTIIASSPAMIEMPDVNITEGAPAGIEYVNIQNNYPMNYDILHEIRGNHHPRVFDMYFNTPEGRIVSSRNISRDEMGIQLQQIHQPVSYVISFHVLNGIVEVETVRVTLRIIDIDDNVPMFIGYKNRPFDLPIFEGGVGRNTISNTGIRRATDNDEGLNTVQSYMLHDNVSGLFSLDVRRDANSGFINDLRLVLNAALDRETTAQYTLYIVAMEGNEYPDSANLTVNITVLDVCDEVPQFPVTRYFAAIEENSPVGSVVSRNISAIDPDIAAVVTYEISGICSYEFEDIQPCNQLDLSLSPFRLDRETGDLTISQELDREEFAEYEITILAMDECGSTGPGSATVVVTVLNINDNAPVVNVIINNSGVQEGLSAGSPIYFLLVEDTDYGMRTGMTDLRFTFTLHDNSTGVLQNTERFRLDRNPQFQLQLNQTLDREETSEYMLVLNVTDWGSPNMSTIFPLPINVVDINDNSPVFQPIQENFVVYENISLLTLLVTLNATDMDLVAVGNGRVSYILPGINDSFPHQELFQIDQHGRLMVNGVLDREKQDTLSVLVEARDNPNQNSGNPRSDFVVVNLTLLDVNDNRPLILTPPDTVGISESESVNTVVFTVTASDNDTEPYSNVSFTLRPSDSPFAINSTTGHVTLVSSLDYETTRDYTLMLVASDGQLESTKEVTILVGDVNDERCVFDRNGPYMNTIYENEAPGFTVVDINATDRDTPTNELRFLIENGNRRGHFRIEPTSGKILTTVSLDRENVSNYTFTVSCNDGSGIPVETTVFLLVIDLNDNIPQFLGIPYNFTISENLPRDSFVNRIEAVDADHANNGAVRYRVLGFTPSVTEAWFNLDEISGEFTTTTELDRENQVLRGVKNSQIMINVMAYDTPINRSSLFNTTLVYIQITDRNDQYPTFDRPSITITLNENYLLGSDFPTRIHATDGDIAPYNRTEYGISGLSSPQEAAMFDIDPMSGVLTLLQTLDYETQQSHTLEVEAIDFHARNQRATQTVIIIVQNVKEVNCTFIGFVTIASLPENSPINHVLSQFMVADINGNPLLVNVPRMMFSITNLEDGAPPMDFGVRNDTANSMLIVFVKDNVDRETPPVANTQIVMRRFNITASDPDTSMNSHGSCSAILTVTVVDENDNSPSFDQVSYTFGLLENNAVSAEIGRVMATDPDFGSNGTPGITYQITASVPFEITSDGMIRTTDSLDREAVSHYDFTVVASDGASMPRSTSVPIRVNVRDENDNNPMFDPTQNRTFPVGEEVRINTIVATLRVSDRDSGIFGEVDVSVGDFASNYFRLEPNGSIVIIKPLDRENTPLHYFTVVARDGGGLTSSASVNIEVQDFNDNPPIFRPVNTIFVPEDMPDSVVFETVVATDADVGINQEVRYAIGNYSLQRTFCISIMSGELSLCVQDMGCEAGTAVADFERKREYDVSIVAYDLGFPRHVVSKTIRIIITGINEHIPLFDKNFFMVFVNETQRSDMEVARIRATDRDRGDQISYMVLENNQTSSLFRYDQSYEAIVNTGILDYSSRTFHELVLQAEDSYNARSSTQVVVIVSNINNNAPVFDSQSIPDIASQPITLPENTAVSTVVWTVHATDEDNATHDAVSYYLVSDDSNGCFSVDSLTGEINVSLPLDFETRSSYTLRVFSEDTGEPRLTSTVPVTLMINIENVNDESPIFNSSTYSFFISENQPVGSFVGRVYAPDRDVGSFGDVRYSIVAGGNGNFEINQSGDILMHALLDRDALAAASPDVSTVSFELRVIASDDAPGLAVRTASAIVYVTIVDVNDNAPEFSEPQYFIRIPPTQRTSDTLMTLSVSDRDGSGNNAYRYEIDTEPGNIPLEISSVGELSLVETIPSAYRPAYYYNIRAIDARDSNLHSSARLELIVETDSDHHPRFNPLRTSISVNELTSPGTLSLPGAPFFQVSSIVTDVDSGRNGMLSYQFAENYPKFAIDGATGAISLKEMLDYEGVRAYNLTVLVMDDRPGIRRTATGTISVTVDPGNEYAPVFLGLPSQLTLSYVPESDVALFNVTATDGDEGSDGAVRYNIYDSSRFFRIESETGILRNQGPLNTDETYNLTIGAFDLGGSHFRSSNTTIRVTIRDASTPRFVGQNPRTISKPETDTIGGFLNTALVTSPPGQTYHIVKQTASGQAVKMFAISESDGRLSTLSLLDYEQTTEYSIIIESRNEVKGASIVERMSDFLSVTLLVTNVNDNTPLFSATEDQTFSEMTPVGTPLFRVHAIDGDRGLEGEVAYDIIEGDSEGTFRINTTSGQVYLDQPLDRETVSAYDLTIRAHDLSNQPESSQITVHVTVTDVNDFVTTYGGRNFSVEVYEFPHTLNGDRILKLPATDEDEGPPLRYNMELVAASRTNGTAADVSNLQSSTFIMHPDTGLVTVGITLDHETIDHYLFHITAMDRLHTAETYLTINILDVNDHTPVATHPEQIIYVWEGQPAGLLVTDRIEVTDGDTGVNSWVKYSLGGGWPSESYFRIDPLSGVIRTNAVIVAREARQTIVGTVIVEDQGINPRSVTLGITITIIDINDHPPVFVRDSMDLSISIASEVGTSIHTFTVTDEDFFANAYPVMFSIPYYYAEARSNFLIGAANGVLTLENRQHQVRSYNFVIHVSNPSYYPSCVEFIQASAINLTINVRPLNTGCPVFSQTIYTQEVPEETLLTRNILQVANTDPDGDAFTYSITNSSAYPFAIDAETGALTLTSALDRERVDSYSLTVVATDDGFPALSCSALVVIRVLDINDHPPVFGSEEYTMSIDESVPVSSRALQVLATDVDLGEAGRVEYSLLQSDVPFRINRNSGEIFTTASLDYDTPPDRYRFTVRATDNGTPSMTSSVNVTIILNGVNEHRPVITTIPADFIVVEEGEPTGSLVYTVMANDSDRGSVLYYSFVNPKPTCLFALNNRTGQINLDPASSCTDDISRRPAQDPNFFIIDTTVGVSDGLFSDSVDLSFMIHNTFYATSQQTSTLPLEIILASVTGVLVIFFVFVGILVVGCICRAKRTAKIRINDTPQSSMELQKRFGSGRSSMANTPVPVYKQTSIGSPPHEHTMNIAHSTGSGASSTRQSYVCGVDAETDQKDRISYPSPGIISRKSQLSRPYRSTSDLGSSTAATDMLSGESQEMAPYPKAQIEKIYAKNADLLNQSDSNESIHMFGSEGGGESDGGDDMLFAKFNDLDDDDDSTTMQDDEDDRSYQRSLSNSRDNLNIAPVMDDPYMYRSTSGMWAPRANNMADTIDQMADYETEDHIRRGQQHYMNEFTKSQEGVSMYGGASTQESTRPLLRHAHPQPPRIPPQHLMQPAPEFYPHDYHGGGARTPKYAGLPMYPVHDMPRGHPIGRHVGGGGSQEVPMPYGYQTDFMHHHPMHREMGGDHSPSSSTPTEGTLNTRATTNEYESDTYSSDTSINTNTESDPPHLRGFSQSGHSQRHGYH